VLEVIGDRGPAGRGSENLLAGLGVLPGDGSLLDTVLAMASEIERFLSKIDFSPGPEACNPWTGGFFSNGRPRFCLSAAPYASVHATRYGWTLIWGPIPSRLLGVLHTCDWPPCMNPMHWFLGTAAVNQADMAAKGRSLFGSRNARTRLAEADILVIKRDLLPLVPIGKGSRKEAGQISIADIARRYGVSHGLINHIRAGRTWRRVM